MKEQINAALRRTTGYQLQKAQQPAPVAPPPAPARPVRSRKGRRLLQRPTFVISSVRSGSTLLRVLLDSHSQVHAPHEMHLKDIRVDVTSRYAKRAMRASRLKQEDMQAALWDWYLARQLERSGKRLLVNKTPSDVHVIDEIEATWPDARFIFLLRHPLSIARSRHKLRPSDGDERNWRVVNNYVTAVEEARQSRPGLTVRYEELTHDPEKVTRELCDFLEVPWEAGMLEYGDQERDYKRNLGDWSDAIRSGHVQPAAPLPPAEEVPEVLRPVARAWGYLPDEPGA